MTFFVTYLIIELSPPPLALASFSWKGKSFSGGAQVMIICNTARNCQGRKPKALRDICSVKKFLLIIRMPYSWATSSLRRDKSSQFCNQTGGQSQGNQSPACVCMCLCMCIFVSQKDIYWFHLIPSCKGVTLENGSWVLGASALLQIAAPHVCLVL